MTNMEKYRIFYPSLFTNETLEHINTLMFPGSYWTQHQHESITNLIKKECINDDDYRMVLLNTGELAWMSLEQLKTFEEKMNGK